MTHALLALTLLALPEPLARLQAACDRGDPAAGLAAFAPGASLALAPDPGPPGRPEALPPELYAGPARLGAFLRAQLPGCRGTLEAEEAGPGRYRVRLRWSTAPFREAGADPAELAGEAELADGRIAALRLEAAPETAARLRAGVPRANAARVRAFFAALDRGDPGALDAVLAEGVVQHSVLPLAPGAAGVRAYYAAFARAFPDARYAVEDVLAQGDRVAARVTVRATHRGPFLGAPATGRAVAFERLNLFRFEGGRCAEHWDAADRLGLLQQLGALPADPAWGPTPVGAEGFR